MKNKCSSSLLTYLVHLWEDAIKMLQRVLSFRRVTLVQVAVPCRAGQIISLIYDFVISYVCISDFPKTSRSRRILTGNGGGAVGQFHFFLKNAVRVRATENSSPFTPSPPPPTPVFIEEVPFKHSPFP